MRWLLLLPLLVATTAWGQIDISAERTILGLGERTTVDVTINGGSGNERPTLEVPAGLTAALVGQRSGFTLSRGRSTGQSTFTFAVTATGVGTHTLGPAKARLGSTSLVSETVEIKVVKAAEVAAPADGAWDWRNRRLRTRAWVSDETPYVGEAIVWTLEYGSAAGRLYVRDEGLDPGALSVEPGTAGRWEYEMTMQDGFRVIVGTESVALFALEPEPTAVKADILVAANPSSLLPGPQEKLSFAAVKVNPRALPAGAPDGFGGDVGRFSLRTSLDTQTVRAGETATLSILIEGTGALRAPEVAIDLPEAVRVYDEDPDVQVSVVGQQVQSRARVQKTLVPLEPGSVRIPPVRFVYFDPDTERYETAMTRPLALEVTGDAVAEPQVARSDALAIPKEEVEILGSDILPLRTGDRLLGDDRVRLTSPLVLALLLLPLLGLGGLLTLDARSRAAGSDRGLRAARRKEAKRAVADARGASTLPEVEAALRAWLGARLERDGGTLSPGEAARVLIEAGAPPDEAQALTPLLERLEAVRFGGEAPGDLPSRLADWLDSIEGSWR